MEPEHRCKSGMEGGLTAASWSARYTIKKQTEFCPTEGSTSLLELPIGNHTSDRQPIPFTVIWKFIFKRRLNMASKAQMIGSTAATQPETAAEEREVLLRSTREEEIRNLAYEIYLQRGGQPGYELEDWLQAERDLTK
jgi:hypothetical protein